MKMFVITHPTFDMQTLVAIGATDKQIKKWVKKHTKVDTDDEFMEIIVCSGFGRTTRRGAFTMLRLSEWEGTNKNIAHLAHEAFHLAEFTFHRIGIVHDVETSGEAYAYFIQHTVEQILDELRKD
ncbi:hypothetical protein KAR10_01110 [bacterium]|nr:hypothetical protein [bacterium]